MAAHDAQRIRDRLLVVLAVTAGATDATAFERLGHVFASVITGNLILLGVSAGSRDALPALFAGCAIAGYVLGVFAGAPRGERDQRVWPVGASVALGLDLALLLVFAVGWEIVGGHPGRAMQVILLTMGSGAMGVQSAAVRRLGNVSTTYLTSTLTGLVESLAIRRWSPSHARALGILGAAVAGAAGATALILYAGAWLPGVQLLPLAVVLIGSRRLITHPAQDATGQLSGTPAS
jgi:uncharacterized membrane protein YoaK (UPF0700 family)